MKPSSDPTTNIGSEQSGRLDAWRKWRDSREVGSLSKVTPLQAALSMNAILESSALATSKGSSFLSELFMGADVISHMGPHHSPKGVGEPRLFRDHIDDYYMNLSLDSKSNSDSNSKYISNGGVMKVVNEPGIPKPKFSINGIIAHSLVDSNDGSMALDPSVNSVFNDLIIGSTIVSDMTDYAPVPTPMNHVEITNEVKDPHSNLNSIYRESNEHPSKKPAVNTSFDGAQGPSTNALGNSAAFGSRTISGKVEQPQNTLYNKLLSNNKNSGSNNSNMSKYSNKSSANDDIDSAPQVDPSKSKYGFASAKTIFVKDGGKIVNNNTSNSNSSLSSNNLNNVGKKLFNSNNNNKGGNNNSSGGDEELPEALQGKGLDKALVDKIESDIIQNGQPVTFDLIAGLKTVKDIIQEIICWPMKRPDLFVGLRSLPRGLLLFGPPGTGKTLIGKAVAHETGATFFSISASSLTSKWIGEGERTVKTLFAVAVYREPSVVFIDEVDSLLCQRSEGENEATRRMKTEIFIQLDGANTNADARVILIGATNRPDELDEAARRRFQKRIYIPLPDDEGRRQLFDSQLDSNPHSLTSDDISELVELTKGYSGADIRLLLTEAAMGPMREMAMRYGNNVSSIRASDIPSISRKHFEDAMENVAPSVSQADLQKYVDWNSTYGSSNRRKN